MSVICESHLAEALERVSSSGERMLREVMELARVNSGTANLRGTRRVQQILRDRLSSLADGVEWFEFSPFEEETEKGTPAVGPLVRLWKRALAPRQVLLNGHVDTVFGADDPFQDCTRVDEATLRGPGVADMKGGLVVLANALEAFETLAEKKDLGWEVILTSDEEIGSPVSRRVLESRAPFSDVGIVFESSPDGSLVRRRMGVGTFQATVQGRSAHVGRSFAEGRNAIAHLAEWVSKLDALNGQVPEAIVNVGEIEGGGTLNVVPAFARAALNVRSATNEAAAAVTAAMGEIASAMSGREGFAVTWEGEFSRPPKESNADVERLLAAWEKVGQQQGIQLGWHDTGGASDGNLLQAAGLPVIDNLGVIGAHLHTDREYLKIDSLVERSQLVLRFLQGMATNALDLPRASLPR